MFGTFSTILEEDSQWLIHLSTSYTGFVIKQILEVSFYFFLWLSWKSQCSLQSKILDFLFCFGILRYILSSIYFILYLYHLLWGFIFSSHTYSSNILKTYPRFFVFCLARLTYFFFFLHAHNVTNFSKVLFMKQENLRFV